MNAELIFAGIPLGPIVSALVEIIKRLGGPTLDRYAVWINVLLSTVAFVLVTLVQQGMISTNGEHLIVLVLGVLTTIITSAGTFDLIGNAKRAITK